MDRLRELIQKLQITTKQPTNDNFNRYFIYVKNGGKLTTGASETIFKKGEVAVFDFLLECGTYADNSNINNVITPVVVIMIPTAMLFGFLDAIKNPTEKTEIILTVNNQKKNEGGMTESTIFTFQSLSSVLYLICGDITYVCIACNKGSIKTTTLNTDITDKGTLVYTIGKNADGKNK